MQSNQGGGVGHNKSRDNFCPLTRQAENEPRQGQPNIRLPYFAANYFWTYGKCEHESSACNNKSSRHHYTYNVCNIHNGRTYGCNWRWDSTKVMVPNIYNKINIIRKTIKLVVDPPTPPIIAKADTGSTAHYFTPEDAHEIFNLQPTNTVLYIWLPDNSMMDPQLAVY